MPLGALVRTPLKRPRPPSCVCAPQGAVQAPTTTVYASKATVRALKTTVCAPTKPCASQPLQCNGSLHPVIQRGSNVAATVD
jgi:hypothetical protein